VTNNATVQPGLSSSGLTIQGNYTQNSGGTLSVQVASSASYSRLTIGGAANLAGGLFINVTGNAASLAGKEFTIITAAGGVNGKFDTTTGTILKIGVIYQVNDVLLEFQQGLISKVTGFHAFTANEQAAGYALDSSVSNPKASKLISYVDALPISALPEALNLFAPEELAAMFDISMGAADVQAANIESRFEEIRNGVGDFSSAGLSINDSRSDFNSDDGISLALFPGTAEGKGRKASESRTVVAPGDKRWGYFVTGNGEFANVGGDSNAHGYNLITSGMTIGLDYRVSPKFAIGLTAGYVHTWVDLVNNGRIDVDGGKGGVYATWFDDGFYVNGAVTGGGSTYDIRRTGLNGSALGTTTGGELDALLGGGYDLRKGNWLFGPATDIEYTYVGISGYDEHGSLAPLRIQNNDASSLRSRLGFHLVYNKPVGGITVSPEVQLGWQHEYLDRRGAIDSRLASGAGDIFTVQGPTSGRDALLVTAGVTVKFSDRLSTFVYYNGELARQNYTLNSVMAGFRVGF